MALRVRLTGRPETLNDFELAAEVRFWEGLELLTAGESAGGVYLMGYAAEMWLKYACFRFDRTGLADPVDARPRAVQNRWRTNLPAAAPESGHSLLFWMELLRNIRAAAGMPLPNHLDTDLVRWTNAAYQNWWVSMRYYGDAVPQVEAEDVYYGVSWLRDNRTQLWR
jgi:hypothetical protein